MSEFSDQTSLEIHRCLMINIMYASETSKRFNVDNRSDTQNLFKTYDRMAF